MFAFLRKCPEFRAILGFVEFVYPNRELPVQQGTAGGKLLIEKTCRKEGWRLECAIWVGL